MMRGLTVMLDLTVAHASGSLAFDMSVESAMRSDGSSFTDKDVHRQLIARGIKHISHEVFRCTVDQVRAAILAVRERTANIEDRTLSFSMRPEQQEAVELTADYFQRAGTEQAGYTPHFLWNAKMRFGKTFAAYQLAKRMGWTKVLVLTFKPTVLHAWAEDLQRHIDCEGWQFIPRDGDLTYDQAASEAISESSSLTDISRNRQRKLSISRLILEAATPGTITERRQRIDCQLASSLFLLLPRLESKQ